MQSMIIFAATLCLAKASYYPVAPAHVALSPDGKFLLDTPEVAHAKAAHLAAHAQASTGHAAWAPAGGAYLGGGHGGYAAGAHYGAPAAGLIKYGPAPLAHDGRVIDTPEVAHLKAAHHAAHSHAAHGAYAHGPIAPLGGLGYGGAALAHGPAYGAGYAGGYGKWSGPQAHIQLTHDGQYVVDTPEVQHARAAHLHQYAAAAHAAAAAPEEPWGHGPHGGWHIIFAATLCLAKASYYPVAPAHVALSPDGKFLLDTPEVAHAKAAHLAAHAQASTGHAAWAPAGGAYLGGGHGGYAAGAHYGAPAAGLIKYGPAPLAHDGRVIDTPEVAHLKAAHHAAHSHAAHGAYAHGPIAPLGGLGYGGAALAHGPAYGAGYAGGYGKWSGPQAHIQLTHDGQYVVDTPEVQHARAAHLHQYAAAAHAAAAAPEEPWGHGPHGGWH